MLLKLLRNISPFRGMPTEEKKKTSRLATITGETIQLYYYSGTTRTIDAGQAAGVAVEATLAFDNIKNGDGTKQGAFRDSSLSFTAGAFTTEVEFPYHLVEDGEGGTPKGLLDIVVANFTNGQYCVDYAAGKMYGKKNSTAVTLAAGTYKIRYDADDELPANTGTLSNVAVSASNFTVLAANADRRGVVIHNDSSNDIYLKFGATATTTSYTWKIAAGDHWTMDRPIYKGILDAISSVATGTLRVTELT